MVLGLLHRKGKSKALLPCKSRPMCPCLFAALGDLGGVSALCFQPQSQLLTRSPNLQDHARMFPCPLLYRVIKVREGLP